MLVGSNPTQLLGYLEFDHETRRSRRFTPEGELIDGNDGRWHEDFYAWLERYQEFWSLNPRDAYFIVDDDLQMDDGL